MAISNISREEERAEEKISDIKQPESYHYCSETINNEEAKAN